MARYLGPKHRMCRRLGEKVCSSDKCPITRRNYPPGVHGVKGRGKLTTYGKQLLEKQKARYTYGLLERQFEGYYNKAMRSREATDLVIMQLLESRLDNVVYRLGLAKTRAAARQLVSHNHIKVNGRKVNIPSYQVKPGQVVSVDPSSLKLPYFVQQAKTWGKQQVSEWLAVDSNELKGQILAVPTKEQMPQNIDMSLIVEYYSK
ncbi:MAG: 30S ribosomal protein S4 [Patescibacteria group bacterium]